MSGVVSVPNLFAAVTTATTPQLDADFAALVAAFNNPLTYAIYAVDSGAANAYAITLSPPPANQAALLGVAIAFKASAVNTTGSTLNVNTLGAQSIVRPGGAATQAGDIVGTVIVVWDGTNYVLQSGTQNSLLGPKNRLINGGCEIWQRNTTIAVTASSNGYGTDRWVLTTGANQASTITQVAGLTTTSQWAAKVQRNNAQTGTTLMVYEQPFELNNIFPLRGQVVTVSFTAKSGANWSPTSGTLVCTLAAGTGAAARRGNSAYTGESVPLTFNSNLTNSATRYSGTSTAIAATTTQFTLYFSWTPSGTAGADDSFTIDDIQLEIGAAATGFELADYEIEKGRCLRYYEQSYDEGVAGGTATKTGIRSGGYAGNATGTTASGGTVVFAVPKRTAPTMAYYDGAGNSNKFSTRVTAAWTDNVASVSSIASSQSSANFDSASTTLQNMFVHFTASAEL